MGERTCSERRLQQSGGCPIDHPGEVSALRANELRRVRARVGVALQDLLQGLGFALPATRKVTALDAFSTGMVRVSRVVPSLSTGLATTHLS